MANNYTPHHLFVLGGTLNAGADSEVWQCGIRVLFQKDPGESEVQFLQKIAPLLKAWFQNVDTLMSAQASLAFLKLNAIGADGKYVNPNVSNQVTFSPVGGGRTALIPSFLGVATSWRTDSTSRKHLNGRIYLPNTPTGGTGSPRIPLEDRDKIASAGETLLSILRSNDGTTDGFLVPRVYSATGGWSNIVSVRVGDVLDVQRRRKNKLRENYKTVPFIP